MKSQNNIETAVAAFREFLHEVPPHDLQSALDDIYFIVSQKAFEEGIETLNCGKTPISEIMFYIHDLRDIL
jgi:hypothetical protein